MFVHLLSEYFLESLANDFNYLILPFHVSDQSGESLRIYYIVW